MTDAKIADHQAVASGFSWDAASPSERGHFIREHWRSSHRLSDARTKELFALTENGLRAILLGSDWRTDFATPAAVEEEAT